MIPMSNKDKEKEHASAEKPIKIPLPFKDALKALLNTPPVPEKKSKKDASKKDE